MKRRVVLIGPTYPYRGGIAHYTTLLAHALSEVTSLLLISFSRQYPQWLFPGKSDRDPSQEPLTSQAEYILDPLLPWCWWRTIKRIEKVQPDVVVMQWWHPFFTPAWSFLIRWLKRGQNTPQLIVICHNVKPHEEGGWLMRRSLPFAIRVALGKADQFLVHSQMDAAHLREILPTAVIDVVSLPTYANVGRVDQPTLPVSLPKNVPIFLFCGFVRPYKGVDILIEAMALLRQQLDAHLVVAGEFWQNGEAPIRQQIAQHNLSNAVTVINEYLPNDQLASLIRQAEAVVLPYRSATQSAVVQMAFGHHVPVITTNVGGLAEAVLDGETGLVVPPENPAALAEAMRRFVEDGLRPQFVAKIEEENGRFAWSHLVEAILAPSPQS